MQDQKLGSALGAKLKPAGKSGWEEEVFLKTWAPDSRDKVKAGDIDWKAICTEVAVDAWICPQDRTD